MKSQESKKKVSKIKKTNYKIHIKKTNVLFFVFNQYMLYKFVCYLPFGLNIKEYHFF